MLINTEKLKNLLRDTRWGEILVIIFTFASFASLFIFQQIYIFSILFLCGLIILLITGFFRDEFVIHFSSLIGYVILAGVIYYICVNPKFLVSLLKANLSITNLPLLWKVWLAFVLLLSVIFTYELTIKRTMVFTKDVPHIGNKLLNLLFQVVIFLTFLLILFKAFEFLAFNTTMEGRKYDFTLQVIALLFTFISVVIAAGYLLIQRRVEKIDKLEEMLKEVDDLLGYSASLVVSNLPSFSVTQHVPHKDYIILKELVNLYEKSIHFKTQIEKEPYISSRIHLALGLYYYAKGDYRSVNYLEKILREQKQTGEVEERIYGLALWRLGIAFIAHFNNPDKARAYFRQMYGELSSYFQIVGRTAESIANLAEYRRTYGSKLWERNRENNPELLKDTLDILQKLKEQLLKKYNIKELFIFWYLLNVRYEMNGKLSDIDKENVDFIARELIMTLEKTQDLSIKANYAMSLAMLKIMCKDSKFDKEIKWLKLNQDWFNRNWKEKAKYSAHQILYEHPYYNLVSSEKEISEIPVTEFLKDHIEKLR